uniref:PhoD-like phosphatase metallophosphatase domain-containing protein n=1 Tax=Bicosoecida sp. CB-2014 TaxID=1486930 RepID=A0A7S1CF27_9STRA
MATEGGLTVAERIEAIDVAGREATVVAFGSCSKTDRDQPLWPLIVDEDPDIFVWLGDVVYADKRLTFNVFEPRPPEEVRQIFETQKQIPGYQALLDHAPVVGVWDDHDFGMNNGGRGFEGRATVQDLFLDFIDEPAESPRRVSDGVYASYTLGGPDQGRTVQLILLDNRYHKDDHGTKGGDMLGEEQWAWLEEQLEATDVNVTLVGTGLQVLPSDRPGGEKWFPGARQRLLRLLNQAAERRGSPVVLLTGDVHFGEMLWTCEGGDGGLASNGVRIVEVTSSGMTHSCETQAGVPLCHFAMWLGYQRSAYSLPAAVAADGTTPIDRGEPQPDAAQRVLEQNFGTVRVNWEDPEPSVEVRVHGLDGSAKLRHRIPLDGSKAAVDERWACPPAAAGINRGRLMLAGVVAACLAGTPLYLLARLVRWCWRRRHRKASERLVALRGAAAAAEGGDASDDVTDSDASLRRRRNSPKDL